jgi:uncharacterized membrane protein YhaH (DUF805 family)
MFIGHYGVALAAKRPAPRVSLGMLIIAAQLVDLVWPILLLLGIERVSIVPNDNPFLRLSFDSYPWSHSLVTTVLWAVLVGGAYGAVRRDRTAGVIVGLLVASHWVLDWITHVPDLPLYPGGPRVGLGLWNSVAGTMIVETLVFLAGLTIYARTTRAVDRTGRWALWAFVGFLALVHVANASSPPPPSETTVAWASLSAWLIPLFGWWVDRHRTAQPA